MTTPKPSRSQFSFMMDDELIDDFKVHCIKLRPRTTVPEVMDKVVRDYLLHQNSPVLSKKMATAEDILTAAKQLGKPVHE